MSSRQKTWTHLGLSAALIAGVSGCAAETEVDTTATEETPITSTDLGEAGAGEMGEGGEGEGGVSIAQAASNPVIYLSALAITEAHFLAGRDAYAAGFTEAAGEMFAHPVSEVLADMEPIFKQRGVVDFTDALLEASDAAYSGASQSEIDAHVATVVAALRMAADSAPSSSMSAGEIAARVVADQIDRAADMYGVAQGATAYEPYLDGYGFYKAALTAFETDRDAITAAVPEALPALNTALEALAQAYPTATRPDTLDAESGALKALASRVALSLG